MRKREYRALAEINVTNLVDVVLVLLIVFMISAPLLQSGIEIDLPKTETAALESDADGVVVTVTRKGAILINKVWTHPDDFKENLDEELKKIGKPTVFLRADSAVSYGAVVEIMGKLQQMGIQDLGLITEKVEITRTN